VPGLRIAVALVPFLCSRRCSVKRSGSSVIACLGLSSSLIAISACIVLAGCSSVSNISTSDQPLATARTGVVTDWSQRHVIFSNPGSESDAIANGEHDKWLRITSSARYNIQQIQRTASWSRRQRQPIPIQPKIPGLHAEVSQADQGKWTTPLTTSTPGGVAIDMYPAKYTFAPIGAPDCTNDFVVFPINVAGSSTQANIVGMNNLYAGNCTGTVPRIRFGYNIGTGKVLTSPVISLTGNKIAFVESIAGGSRFHVVTLDTPNATGNGTASAPVTPGTGNAAKDVAITLSGGVMDTDSPPFIDYDQDIAYIGDDSGKLHKVTGVFTGTPTEVTTAPWPVTVISGSNLQLTGPVFDNVSKKIFIGGFSSGSIYCVLATGALCSTPSINVGTGINDAPLVDSTNQTVFISNDTAASGGVSAVNQVNTSLGNRITTTIGTGGNDLYNGAFDNAYYTSPASGHYYVCGGTSTAAQPTLYSIGFSSSGQMNTTTVNSAQLVVSGSGPTVDCSPISEAYNTSTSKDYIYLSVKNGGFTSLLGLGLLSGPNCGVGLILPVASPCIIAADVTSGFPTQAAATSTASSGTSGTSGFIIDNFVSASGGAQIYFGDLTNGLGTQLSQTTLQ
jgi:hypothetical protein